MPAIPTTTAAALLALLGVNTHLSWSTQAWRAQAWPTIEADLAYIGVRHVRDDPPVAQWTLPEYVRLARRGVHFDILTGPRFETTLPAGIDALEREVPGAVAAIEGANEINLYPVAFQGLNSGREPGRFARAFQSALYRRVRDDPALAGVPVYNLTLGNPTPALIADLGDMTDMADVANWHPYSEHRPPAESLRRGAAQARQVVRGKPLVFTEAGYCGDVAGAWCSATRAQQAAWTLDLWLDSASLGARVYVYALADNAARHDPADAENGFGLFDAAGHPYAVAAALHAFAAIIAAPDAPRDPKPLQASITGEVEALGLARSDGSAQLILWNEAGATPVTVTLPTRHARIAVFDPLRGTAPVALMTATATAQVTVTDHPLILAISRPGVGLDASTAR
jgi:hypothetical protein